jgi:hypothetical protein
MGSRPVQRSASQKTPAGPHKSVPQKMRKMILRATPNCACSVEAPKTRGIIGLRLPDGFGLRIFDGVGTCFPDARMGRCS